MKIRWKINYLFLCVGLFSCNQSVFLTRKYTKGFYNESNHTAYKNKLATDNKPIVLEQQINLKNEKTDIGTLTAFNLKKAELNPTKIHTKTSYKNNFSNDRQPDVILNPKIFGKNITHTLKKYTQNKKVKVAKYTKVSEDNIVTRTILFILAFLLAVAIIGLAIYLSPAILPAYLVSIFWLVIIVLGIIALAIIISLIVRLVQEIIDLFSKHDKIYEL